MATKALFRADDIEGIQSLTGRKYELVRGELYEMVTTPRHGTIIGRICSLVGGWNQRSRAGGVGVRGGFKLESDPDTVRGPDVSFVRKGASRGSRPDEGSRPSCPMPLLRFVP